LNVAGLGGSGLEGDAVFKANLDKYKNIGATGTGITPMSMSSKGGFGVLGGVPGLGDAMSNISQSPMNA